MLLCLATRIKTEKSNEIKSGTKKSKKGKEDTTQTNKNNKKKQSRTQTHSLSESRFRCNLLDNGGQSDTAEDSMGQRKTMADNREKLEGQIKTFLNDPKRSELTFSADLTSQERFTVHRLAEEFGLEHVSKGTGEERFIAIAKKETSDFGKNYFL